MSVKLRLMRVGKKKQPTYRIVAADSRSPRDGRFIEIVGTYAPRSDPSEISVKSDKALEWLSKGAQPTETAKPAKDRTRPSRKGPAVKAAPKKKAAVAKAATAGASAEEG